MGNTMDTVQHKASASYLPLSLKITFTCLIAIYTISEACATLQPKTKKTYHIHYTYGKVCAERALIYQRGEVAAIFFFKIFCHVLDENKQIEKKFSLSWVSRARVSAEITHTAL